MALGVVSIVVLTYLTLNRPPPPPFPGPSSAGAAETTPTAPSASPASGEGATPEPLRFLVVADGFTTADAAAGEPSWPELVRADMDAAGRPVELTVAAAERAGYAEPDSGGATFPQLVQGAGSGFDAVVFFGSRHDIAAAPEVRAAAERAFSLARTASPDAGLLVIGPAWADTGLPGYIVTNRDALAAAVVPFGAVFVDPLAEAWFAGPAAAFIAPDGVHVTAEGHRYLADLIRPVIEDALPPAG